MTKVISLLSGLQYNKGNMVIFSGMQGGGLRCGNALKTRYRWTRLDGKAGLGVPQMVSFLLCREPAKLIARLSSRILGMRIGLDNSLIIARRRYLTIRSSQLRLKEEDNSFRVCTTFER